MVTFRKITFIELYAIGIRFKTKDEYDAFTRLIQEEYESRIRKAIARGRTAVEMAMLEACTTEEETNAWLDKYFPTYEDTVQEIEIQLEKELIQNRSKIPGVIYYPPNENKDKAIHSEALQKTENQILSGNSKPEEDSKGNPSFLNRKAFENDANGTDINSKGIPSYLQKKQNSSVKNIDDWIRELSVKTFSNARRGYDALEVHVFFQNLITELKSQPITDHTIGMILDIDFEVSDWGYDMRSVDEYLDMVADAFERFVEKRPPNNTIDKPARQFGNYGSYKYTSPNPLNLEVED